MGLTHTAIIETIKAEPMPVTKIAHSTNLSVSYVRTQLTAMEAAGIIERVDDRVPIYYRINPNSPARQKRELIDKNKKALLKPLEENEPPLGEFVKKYPKSLWPQIAEAMEVMCQAMKELNEEGKLIDTL